MPDDGYDIRVAGWVYGPVLIPLEEWEWACARPDVDLEPLGYQRTWLDRAFRRLGGTVASKQEEAV